MQQLSTTREVPQVSDVASRGEAGPERAGRGGRLSWSRLPLAAAAAVVAVAAANALLFAAESAAGVIPGDAAVPSMLGVGPVSYASVILTSVAVTAAAAGLLAVVALLSRRPVPVFWIVSGVLAALSLAMPATVPGAPAGMRVGLAAMHVVAWAVSAAVLTRLAGPRP
jgi:hypothetical protein